MKSHLKFNEHVKPHALAGVQGWRQEGSGTRFINLTAGGTNSLDGPVSSLLTCLEESSKGVYGETAPVPKEKVGLTEQASGTVLW